MGMFDDVNYECVCPVCHSKVYGFQSKDGQCVLAMIEPTSVRNFYSSCGKCGVWIEFTASDYPLAFTNFSRSVTGKDDVRLTEYDKEIKLK